MKRKHRSTKTKSFPIMLCSAELKWTWWQKRKREHKEEECRSVFRIVYMYILFIFVAGPLFPPLGCEVTQIYIRVTWREHLFPEKQAWLRWESQESMMMECVFKLLRHQRATECRKKNSLVFNLISLNLHFLPYFIALRDLLPSACLRLGHRMSNACTTI